MEVIDMRNEPQTADNVAEEPQPKQRKTLIFVLCIIILCALAYIVYSQIINPAGGDRESSPKPVKMYEFPQLTINPADSEGRRFVVISLAAELDPEKSKKLSKELENKNLKLKHILIETIGSKTVEDLETQKDELRQEILDKLNETLLTGKLKEIYFTSFIIQ
jgi:flagellar FliL protein